MKILILTGKFGMGHYSVSEAIGQEISSRDSNIEVSIVDILDYLMPTASKILYKSFNTLVTKWSNLYNFVNINNEDNNIKTFNYFFVKGLDRLFLEFNPDIVISTLPISSQYISKYKSLKKSNIPLFTFITDISSHSEWIHKNTDFYFVGDISIKKSLIDKGIDENKIIVSGIPVKQGFKDKIIKFDKNKSKEILIMGGGLGLISFNKNLFESLNNEKNIKTTVITGNNKKMFEQLKSKYKNIEVLGYTNKIDFYMKRADLIISKSGGITLFEAIYSETPIYVVNPFLLQEVKNAKFIEKRKIGQVVWNEEMDIAKDILSLINDDKAILKMKSNMKKVKENINQEEILSVIEQFKKEA
ncbi:MULTISPECIES: glycosyltransferase [Clostridia]|jgi:processive 1,2-diacylglycerol beta-glucosyltransferase|uniref:Glycosyltransferase n=1 Tax=Clostridium saudiense TaxID=1414720 RepID=A0ABS2FCM3_9CLOT|nr:MULTISPECIES: glycosyltransferase [Clostridiaceae]MBM6818295.1 glycosyltransferase [Clostridium saudiense]MDU4884180.1 glycosyltransferase [Clostridium celatum]MDU7077389.1 glycosyltransferase [Clostridium celatum]